MITGFRIIRGVPRLTNCNAIGRRYHSGVKILGIETSCDDTGAAIVDDSGKILGESIHSQQDIHLKHGGIIPPVAQELHREHIQRVVTEAIRQAGVELHDLDAIAVTNRPGLKLSLIVGTRYAKHLARHSGLPIIPIHHMEAHSLMARMENKIEFPFLCLLASGGHCILTLVKNTETFLKLGETLDDAPGEALDKIARRLKLRNLPEFAWKSGGESIEIAAKRARGDMSFDFPLPLARMRDCQFSFAGMKNNAIRHIKATEMEYNLLPDEIIPNYEDFCKDFLKGITRHIVHRTQRAIEYCERNNLFDDASKRTLVFSGGVACNDYIFNSLTELASQFGYTVLRPRKKLCTDNGVMIAWNGIERYCENKKNAIWDIDSIDVYPKEPLGSSLIEHVASSSLKCKWVKLKTLAV